MTKVKISKTHDELKGVTRELTIFKRKANVQNKHNLTTTLFQAWNRRNLSEVAKLSRSIAGTSIGVRNRNYRVFPRLASSQEWTNHLTKDAREGGLTATKGANPGVRELRHANERCGMDYEPNGCGSNDNHHGH